MSETCLDTITAPLTLASIAFNPVRKVGRFGFLLATSYLDLLYSYILLIVEKTVYERLLYRSNRKDMLSFHVLASLALNPDNTLKHSKVKELIKIFRPQRDGSLSVLDFVKSVDTVVRVDGSVS
jgi:hypothetical protein